MTPPKSTALITGASLGIGLELAKLFAQDGHDLVLVARNQQALDNLARDLHDRYGVAAHGLAADLAQAGAPQMIWDHLQHAGMTVDYLVNNAGFGSWGFFAESDPQRDLDMIAVNITALTHLTRLFLPGMLSRRRGRILNVASTAGFQPGPLMAEYYATKAYVVSLTEALANELTGSGVTASVLCPGPTATEFQARAGLQESKLFASHVMRADEVARYGYRKFLQGQTTIIPGARNRFLLHVERFAPRALVPRIVRAMQESRSAK
jgi:short-subunit dehydrogenase